MKVAVRSDIHDNLPALQAVAQAPAAMHRKLRLDGVQPPESVG